MFDIDYIKLLNGNFKEISKNLKEGDEYVYRFSSGQLSDDFFAPNISVHAIVGKNGSGKSTLIEILFRLINNLSYVLMKFVHRDAADQLCYVFGLYAEVGWHDGIKQGFLRCENNKVTFRCGDFEIVKEIGDAKELMIHTVEYNFNNELEVIKEMANHFFYTLSVNYSMQAYIAQDYLGEDTKSVDKKRHKSSQLEDVWINALFHKNDGYMSPINLNPFRDRGKIDMNKETWLTRSRVAALLQYFKQDGIHLIDNYQLWDVAFVYNRYIVNNYFGSDDLLALYNTIKPTTDEELLKQREENKNNDDVKHSWIVELFREALKSEEVNIPKIIIDNYKVDVAKLNQLPYELSTIYLICKVLNTGLTYPSYIIKTNSASDYKMIDALTPECSSKAIDGVLGVIKTIDGDDSHVTLKIRRTLNYLHNYDVIYNIVGDNIMPPDEHLGFTASDYRKAFIKTREGIQEKLTLHNLELLIPPSIYKMRVFLVKDEDVENPDGKQIELEHLSSGERQFVFSLSSIIYHLTNLRSVLEENPKYHRFHIIVDEVEICFHPEYQRVFISKLLELLTRLRMNERSKLSIWVVTHSPFILSDFPQCNIMYLENGEQKSAQGIINPFGANINDIIRQNFFLAQGFMGEFSRNCTKSLIHYLDPHEGDGFNDLPDIYKFREWSSRTAKDFINQISEPMLRMQLQRLYRESKRISKEDKIQELYSEIERLRNEENTH